MGWGVWVGDIAGRNDTAGRRGEVRRKTVGLEEGVRWVEVRKSVAWRSSAVSLYPPPRPHPPPTSLTPPPNTLHRYGCSKKGTWWGKEKFESIFSRHVFNVVRTPPAPLWCWLSCVPAADAGCRERADREAVQREEACGSCVRVAWIPKSAGQRVTQARLPSQRPRHTPPLSRLGDGDEEAKGWVFALHPLRPFCLSCMVYYIVSCVIILYGTILSRTFLIFFLVDIPLFRLLLLRSCRCRSHYLWFICYVLVLIGIWTSINPFMIATKFVLCIAT